MLHPRCHLCNAAVTCLRYCGGIRYHLISYSSSLIRSHWDVTIICKSINELILFFAASSYRFLDSISHVTQNEQLEIESCRKTKKIQNKKISKLQIQWQCSQPGFIVSALWQYGSPTVVKIFPKTRRMLSVSAA